MAVISRKTVKVLLILSIFTCIAGFNLDTEAPIIKIGSQDSFFGFSVAQHRIGRDTSVFIVGAPRDNITDPSVSNEVRTLVRPGAVYSCPLTSYKDDCDWLRIDAEEPFNDDQKDGQWMGVSVASTGTENGGAVACAHRYTRGGQTDAFRWGLGQCVTMTNELDEDQYMLPCGDLPKAELHTDYGLCQAGASAAVDKDGDLLVGAPGSRSWRGAAFKNSISQELDADTNWYRSPADDADEDGNNPPAVRYYSYLGMSSLIAEVNGMEKSYIAGAPRSNDAGQVLLFRLDDDGMKVTDEDYLTGDQYGSWFGCDFTVLDLNGDGKNDIVVGAPFYNDDAIGGAIYIYLNSQEGITSNTKPKKITSRKMTRTECKEVDCENARFGYSVERLGDIDLDGYEDFAVGAPFEGNGVLYIFRGQDNEHGVDEEYSQRIMAEDLQSVGDLSSFGYSLSGGQDMDGNGYPDLVVGNFQADKALILRARPVVKVDAVMYSEPTKINPKKRECDKDGRNLNCFEIHVCFNFSAEPKSQFTEKIDLDYRLEAEIFTGKRYSRVFLKGAKKPEEYALEKTIELNDQFDPRPKCREHLVYIVANTKDFLNAISFRLTYRLSDSEMVVPEMNEGDPVPDINTYPILNAATAEVIHSVPFEKNCGDDEVCKSDLSVRAQFRLPVDDDGEPLLKVGQVPELSMEVTVRNLGEDAHDSNIYMTLPEHVTWKGTRDATDETKTGPGCSQDIFNPLVWSCSVGNPLRQGASFAFIVLVETKSISSSVRTMTFHLKVNTTSFELNEPDNIFIQDIRVAVESNLYLRGRSIPSEVFYSGKVRGESDIEFEDEIGSQVIHNYELRNTMAGVVKNSHVTIKWPYEVQSKLDHGKHLLYLMEPPLVDKPNLANCSVQAGIVINPAQIKENPRYKLAYRQPSRRPIDGGEGNYTVVPTTGAQSTPAQGEGQVRRKRETVIRSESVTEKDNTFEVVTMDCRKGTARCFDIKCDVGQLKKSEYVIITLRSRLWNHTFVEDYRNVDRVEIYSSAKVEIDPVLNIKETNTTDNKAEAKTRALPDIKVQKDQQIPWWVYLIAILGGILVLVLIIIALWKCGFFKRNQKDALQSYKGKLEKKKYDDDL